MGCVDTIPFAATGNRVNTSNAKKNVVGFPNFFFCQSCRESLVCQCLQADSRTEYSKALWFG